jgi:glycosyltransferase involved in cell wall biosynthesis
MNANDRPLRIALVTPEYPGCGPAFGIGRYLTDLAHGLAHRGHHVLVVAATDTGCFLITPGTTPQVVAPAIPHLLLRPLLARRFLDQRLTAFAPDVIEFPNWGGLGALLSTRRPRVVRLVTSAADPSHGAWSMRTPIRLACELATVIRANMVVADSHAMADCGERLYGRRADAVTYLGHPGPRRPPPVAAPPRVLFVGRLESRKGIDVLIAAWPQVRALFPEAELHIVGKPHPDWSSQAAHLPGTMVHGRLEDHDVASIRATCRVQVIPSRFESFGLVALEAWADGLAVVASRTGGLAEVVSDAGILVEPGDPTALASALCAALAPQRARDLAHRGQQRLLEAFAADRWLIHTIAQYRRVMACHDP